MSRPHPDVDAFVRSAERWQAVIRKLRAVLLDCGLDEEFKWAKPCYTHERKNVAIVQPFEEHCALMFFDGALLEDPRGLLRRQGPHSRSARRLEFTRESDVKKTLVRDFVGQAIAAKQQGRRSVVAAENELVLPTELVAAMEQDRELAEAFRGLTPGRQRGYVLHIGAAKQSATRAARVARCSPRILEGKGLRDR